MLFPSVERLLYDLAIDAGQAAPKHTNIPISKTLTCFSPLFIYNTPTPAKSIGFNQYILVYSVSLTSIDLISAMDLKHTYFPI